VNDFWEHQVEPGYYDKILNDGLIKEKGIQSNWHNLTFLKMSQFISSEKNHLDFACGPGTFIGKYLSSRSIGVDISKSQIDYARNKYGSIGKFYTNDNFEMNNYDEEFDVVTVIGLLEFINEDQTIELLNNLNSVTKPGGKLYFTTPNYNGLMFLLEKIVNLTGGVNYQNQHISRYSKAKVSNLFHKTQFTNIKVKKIINIGVSFSIFGHKLGRIMEKAIERLFNNSLGFILLIEVKK
tara:strand:+ start:319 stop:1032 length:714 start_codon:yes stop_codon:yes gene_type:complete